MILCSDVIIGMIGIYLAVIYICFNAALYVFLRRGGLITCIKRYVIYGCQILIFIIILTVTIIRGVGN